MLVEVPQPDLDIGSQFIAPRLSRCNGGPRRGIELPRVLHEGGEINLLLRREVQIECALADACLRGDVFDHRAGIALPREHPSCGFQDRATAKRRRFFVPQ